MKHGASQFPSNIYNFPDYQTCPLDIFVLYIFQFFVKVSKPRMNSRPTSRKKNFYNFPALLEPYVLCLNYLSSFFLLPCVSVVKWHALHNVRPLSIANLNSGYSAKGLIWSAFSITALPLPLFAPHHTQV